MDTKMTHQIHTSTLYTKKTLESVMGKTESSKPVDLQNPRTSLVENIQVKKPVDIHSPRASLAENRKLKSS
jgi:hypothetical protein